MYVTNKGESIRKSAYVCCVDLQKVFDTVEVTDAFKILQKRGAPNRMVMKVKVTKQNISGVFFSFTTKFAMKSRL
jgi:hypothetical protein